MCKKPHLPKTPRVEERVDSLAHRELPRGVRLGDFRRPAHAQRYFAPRREFSQAMGIGIRRVRARCRLPYLHGFLFIICSKYLLIAEK